MAGLQKQVASLKASGAAHRLDDAKQALEQALHEATLREGHLKVRGRHAHARHMHTHMLVHMRM